MRQELLLAPFKGCLVPSLTSSDKELSEEDILSRPVIFNTDLSLADTYGCRMEAENVLPSSGLLEAVRITCMRGMRATL